jgi:predicted HTH transcriptional regulator
MLRVIGFAEAAGSGVPAILRAVRTNKLAIPELITTNNRVTLRINTSPFINSIVKKYNLQLINQYMIGEQYMILYAIFTSF